MERLSENEDTETQELEGGEAESLGSELERVSVDHALPQRFTRLAERAREHVENIKAPNTRRAYRGARLIREKNRIKDFEIERSALLNFYHALQTLSVRFCW